MKKNILTCLIATLICSFLFITTTFADEVYNNPFGNDDLILVSWGGSATFVATNFSGTTLTTRTLYDYATGTYLNVNNKFISYNGVEYKQTAGNLLNVVDLSLGDGLINGFPLLLPTNDYYLIITLLCSTRVDADIFTFNPTQVSLRCADNNGDLKLVPLQDLNVYDINTQQVADDGWCGKLLIARIADVQSAILSTGITINDSVGGGIPNNIRLSAYILPQSTSDTSGDLQVVINLLNQINISNDNINGIVDNVNNNIINGDDNTSGIVNDYQSNKDDLIDKDAQINQSMSDYQNNIRDYTNQVISDRPDLSKLTSPFAFITQQFNQLYEFDFIKIIVWVGTVVICIKFLLRKK